ncbi:MAG: YIP1 family protein [Verrucomicrobiota bacterium]
MDSTTTPPALPPEPMSLVGRLFNVFATPGDVFDSLRAGGWSAGNWVVPMILAMVVAMGSVLVMFSQPALMQQIQQQQDKAFDDQVAKGKMSEKQADEIKGKMASVTKIVTPIFAAVGGCVGVFGTALVAWLVGRFVLRGEIEFTQALEVTGLATMISVLGGIVKTLLIVVKGTTFVSAGPILLLSAPDMQNLTHQMIAALDVVTFWHFVVLGIGLAKLTGGSTVKATAVLYAVWLAFCGAGILFGRLMAGGF